MFLNFPRVSTSFTPREQKKKSPRPSTRQRAFSSKRALKKTEREIVASSARCVSSRDEIDGVYFGPPSLSTPFLHYAGGLEEKMPDVLPSPLVKFTGSVPPKLIFLRCGGAHYMTDFIRALNPLLRLGIV